MTRPDLRNGLGEADGKGLRSALFVACDARPLIIRSCGAYDPVIGELAPVCSMGLEEIEAA